MRPHLTALALLLGVLASCGFVHEEQIVGPYSETAVDLYEQMAICEETSIADAVHCVIPPTVFARGNDDAFIIAKQYPPKTREGREPDKSTTNFWIIRVADRSVFGPLNEPQFDNLRTKLGVPASLAFSTVHKELM